ncbi:MAG: TonB-dependent receptor, partial [Novosphingobium sp.]
DIPLNSGTLSARFDGAYQSQVYTNAFNAATNSLEPRFLANARLSYTTEDKGWQVAVEVQNLFNKYYYQTVEDVKSAFGTITAAPGLPRTWAVTMKKTF